MGGIERVVEIAASTRVLRERRLVALANAPGHALLGREFVTLRGLAERCAAETGVPVRALLDGAGQTALVAACARGKGELGRQLAERPGFAVALAETLRDLRDAGVPPGALAKSAANLAEVYTDLEWALESLTAQGIFDRIGLFRLAQRGARSWVERNGFARAEVYGATELVGSAGDLVAALADALPRGGLRFFQPDFANEYAETLRAEWSWRFTPEPVEVVENPALDPDGELPEGVLSVRRARSPRDELEAVAREVLTLIENGVAPREIQIVARSLEPYAPWLERTLRGYGIPFTSSLALPEVREPAKRAWLDLARVLARDLPRAPLLRLLGAPDLRLPRDLASDLAAVAERCAREAAVVRGEADWRAALAYAHKTPQVRDALERILARASQAATALAAAPDFTTAARVVAELGAALLGDDGARWARGPLAAVARLDAIRAAAGSSAAPSRSDFAAAFEQAFLELRATPFGDDTGGVRVLDAVQARAVPCSHLFLIGMVHGAWPRQLAEDPFLPDAARAELRARTGRPVPLRERAPVEERFLLGLLLSQAREKIVLSFPESDANGRAQTPSSLLRALPFVARATNVLAAETPAFAVVSPAFLRPAEALVFAAQTGDDASIARIAALLPDDAAARFTAGRLLIARTDALADAVLPYDGEVGNALVLPAALSPSTLQDLGRCPLQTLFNRLLKARALEAPGADELNPSEAGQFVHHVLEAIYRELYARGLLRPGVLSTTALAEARRLLPGALTHAGEDQRTRVRERHPTAWAAFVRTTGLALDDFLVRDLAELLPAGVESLETEHPIRAELSVGAERLTIEGTIDRVARLAGETRVGDYKTSRQFGQPLERGRIRKGLALQLPLYARAIAALEPGAKVVGQVLTVPLRPERDRDDARSDERIRPLEQLVEWSETAFAELGSLLRRGVFPLSTHDEACRYCDYVIACRINHPPSRARVQNAELASGYTELRSAR